MAMNLIKANGQRDSGKLDEVIEDLSNIRWGFQRAIEIQTGVKTLDQVLQEQAELEQTAQEQVAQNQEQDLSTGEDNDNAG